jgi:hypothetical protein
MDHTPAVHGGNDRRLDIKQGQNELAALPADCPVELRTALPRATDGRTGGSPGETPARKVDLRAEILPGPAHHDDFVRAIAADLAKRVLKLGVSRCAKPERSTIGVEPDMEDSFVATDHGEIGVTVGILVETRHFDYATNLSRRRGM